MKYFGLFFLGLVLMFPGCVSFGVQQYKSIQFERHCGGYLKLAADANTIPLARERLNKALNYVEAEGLTKGTTSVLWTTPSRDIGEWYKNLKLAQTKLEQFPANATEADENTALAKLRETLLDHTDEGDQITVPSGISRCPYNAIFFLTDIIFLLLFIIGLLMDLVVGCIVIDEWK